jgi:uncharacterized membrane protein (UPF0127 family)
MRRLPGIARASLLLVLAFAGAVRAADPARTPPTELWIPLGGETFRLELALDPGARRRGLSGRSDLQAGRGLLFVLPRRQPMAMVMRDCAHPLDVAFLDSGGRVISIHQMRPESPRRPGESASQYESRLPEYASETPAQFAIEVAGGRLSALGVRVGDRIPFDGEALIAWAR